MSEESSCVHCGADCGKNPVSWNKLNFCCNGCSQVYQLLNENRLYKYYAIDTTPGIKSDEEEHYEGRYQFLDKQEVKDKIYLFHEGSLARVEFYIPSIHCASCIWLLENLNRLNGGIKQSSVNFVKKVLNISFNTDETTLRKVVELLASIHYTPEISLKTISNKSNESDNKKLLYKIGVAGFIFGNVMLYSLPEYFNGEPLNESLGSFLTILSYVLTIPILFYCGNDYLISAFKNLIRGIINIDLPIALGIITLFTVTSYEVITGSGSGYSDSLSGFIFFLLIGRYYQGKTYQALSFDRDYKSYFPVAVSHIQDGVEHSKLLEEIVTGDILLIRNRELIPADSILIDGQALIDYSFVTGESNLVSKVKGDLLYAGGIQQGGAICIEVKKEILQSHLTQLWNQANKDKNTGKSLVSIVDLISKYFTLIVLGIALCGLLWWGITDSINSAILVFTSVLIVACPCALALSLPFTFGNAMRALGLSGMYLKNLSVIEKILKTDTIVFDKTGTLTRPKESTISFVGDSLSNSDLAAALSLARQSTHPFSIAIAQKYADIKHLPTIGYVEVPGRGIYASVNNRKVKLGSAEYIEAEAVESTDLSSRVYLSIDDKIRGYFSLSNSYREGFDTVLKSLGERYELYLLSGDNEAERQFLSEYFKPENIYFNQSPLDKKEFIESLQSHGKNVLMTGDGLNDSGAFIKSDVALSIADDIYHFSPAGDAIIKATRFYMLTEFISYCRRSMSLLKISFALSLLYNILGLTFALSGKLSPVVAAILMPASSISVVLFATLSTRLLARFTLQRKIS